MWEMGQVWWGEEKQRGLRKRSQSGGSWGWVWMPGVRVLSQGGWVLRVGVVLGQAQWPPLALLCTVCVSDWDGTWSTAATFVHCLLGGESALLQRKPYPKLSCHLHASVKAPSTLGHCLYPREAPPGVLNAWGLLPGLYMAFCPNC